MSPDRLSYAKTMGAAGVAALGSAVGCAMALHPRDSAAVTLRLMRAGSAIILGACAISMVLVAVGAWIALRRHDLERRGIPYASATPLESTGPVFGRLRRWLRRAGFDVTNHLGFRAGDEVDIRPLDEIMATLDARGTVGGLPFMPEMAMMCGTRAIVLRRVDKLHDWIGGTGLRRVRGTVLLRNVRCDGLQHGGCQSGCHIRWHESWLRRPNAAEPSRQRHAPSTPATVLPALLDWSRDAPHGRFRCQATELAAGSAPLRRWIPIHWIRDLVTGNVRLTAWLGGVCLAAFNLVQGIRKGVPSPHLQARASRPTPHLELNLSEGELVRVRTKRQIEDTLDAADRNRGLRFDPEMVRHCGGVYRVRARLSRVISERTGELVQLSTPSVLLEGVTATGEYVAWNPENEFIFWREIWLERLEVPGPAPSGQVET